MDWSLKKRRSVRQGAIIHRVLSRNGRNFSQYDATRVVAKYGLVENNGADMQVDSRLDLRGVTSVHADDVPSVDYYPGVRRRTLLASETPGRPRILQVEIDAGKMFLDLDVHNSGPEYIYVVEGVFSDGVHEYPPGTFIRHPSGSSHIPQS